MTKRVKFTVVKIFGSTLCCEDKDGNRVQIMPKLGQHPQVGDEILAYQQRSLQTKVFGGHTTQWKESVPTGTLFWKQALPKEAK